MDYHFYYKEHFLISQVFFLQKCPFEILKHFVISQLVPQAVQLAIEENVEFRRGLPRDYNRYMGIAHSEKVCTHIQAHTYMRLCL